MLQYASNRLKATEEELLDALAGKLTADHIFVLSEILDHIEDLERRITVFSKQLLTRLKPYKAAVQGLQTIPGIDLMRAAVLMAEIGDDMTAFTTAEKLASWAGVCPGNL